MRQRDPLLCQVRYEAGLVGRADTFTVETLAGIMTPRLLVEEKVVAVTVDMGSRFWKER